MDAESSICERETTSSVRSRLVIFSDASDSGWGALCGSVTAKGHWNSSDRSRHINERELLVALFSSKVFTRNVSNVSIHLMLDNSTSVHYINNSGGTHSTRLNLISRDIVYWCERHRISIHAIHLPRDDEHHYGSAIESPTVFRRLEITSESIPTDSQDLVDANRFIRSRGEPSITTICQLGSTAGRHQCFYSELEPHNGPRVSPSFSSPQMSLKSQEKPSVVSGNSPGMALPVVISHVAGNVSVTTAGSTRSTRSTTGPERVSASPIRAQSTPSCRLEIIRQRFRDGGFSGEVIQFLLDGDSETTSASYQSA